MLVESPGTHNKIFTYHDFNFFTLNNNIYILLLLRYICICIFTWCSCQDVILSKMVINKITLMSPSGLESNDWFEMIFFHIIFDAFVQYSVCYAILIFLSNKRNNT